MMDEVYSITLNLMDTPLSDPELKLFTDGSSFVQGRWQKAGFTVTTANNIVQAEALPQGWYELNFGYWSMHYGMQRESG
jgi:hypothetical protein